MKGWKRLQNINAVSGKLGEAHSSLIWGFSLCLKPTDSRANPDEATTDWRARRGKTAHRVRREGTAIAVPYPYPSTLQRRSRPAAIGRSKLVRRALVKLSPHCQLTSAASKSARRLACIAVTS